MLGMLPLGLF
jgi:transformation/transcription domain-associated protein